MGPYACVCVHGNEHFRGKRSYLLSSGIAVIFNDILLFVGFVIKSGGQLR